MKDNYNPICITLLHALFNINLKSDVLVAANVMCALTRDVTLTICQHLGATY
jgi:hypothetical protein